MFLLDPPQFQLVKEVDLIGQSIDALMAQVNYCWSTVCLLYVMFLLDRPQFQLVKEVDLIGQSIDALMAQVNYCMSVCNYLSARLSVCLIYLLQSSSVPYRLSKLLS